MEAAVRLFEPSWKKSRVITVYIHCSTFQISNAVFATLPHWLSVVHIETDGNLAPFVHNPSNVSWASRQCLHWLLNSTHFWSEEFYCQKLSPHTGRPHGPDDSKTLTFTSYFQDRDLTTMRTTVLMNSPCAKPIIVLALYLHRRRRGLIKRSQCEPHFIENKKYWYTQYQMVFCRSEWQ